MHYTNLAKHALALGSEEALCHCDLTGLRIDLHQTLGFASCLAPYILYERGVEGDIPSGSTKLVKHFVKHAKKPFNRR